MQSSICTNFRPRPANAFSSAATVMFQQKTSLIFLNRFWISGLPETLPDELHGAIYISICFRHLGEYCNIAFVVKLQKCFVFTVHLQVNLSFNWLLVSWLCKRRYPQKGSAVHRSGWREVYHFVSEHSLFSIDNFQFSIDICPNFYWKHGCTTNSNQC